MSYLSLWFTISCILNSHMSSWKETIITPQIVRNAIIYFNLNVEAERLIKQSLLESLTSLYFSWITYCMNNIIIDAEEIERSMKL